MMGKFRCDCCGEDGKEVLHRFKNIWMCEKCFDDLFELYKTHVCVRETLKLSKKIEKALDKVLRM